MASPKAIQRGKASGATLDNFYLLRTVLLALLLVGATFLFVAPWLRSLEHKSSDARAKAARANRNAAKYSRGEPVPLDLQGAFVAEELLKKPQKDPLPLDTQKDLVSSDAQKEVVPLDAQKESVPLDASSDPEGKSSLGANPEAAEEPKEEAKGEKWSKVEGGSRTSGGKWRGKEQEHKKSITTPHMEERQKEARTAAKVAAATQAAIQRARSVGRPITDDMKHRYRQRMFHAIYKHRKSRTHGSASGSGSQMDYTENVRRFLGVVFKAYGVKSLLDSPSGDCHWQTHIPNFEKLNYVGVDIVQEMVKWNKYRFKGKLNMRFFEGDFVSEDLPQGKYDMVLSRDTLQHLPLEDGVQAYQRMEKTGAKYLLTSFHSNCLVNKDIRPGRCRFLNLMLPPFNFSAPIMYALEGLDPCESRLERLHHKMIGLWKLPALGMGDGRSFLPVSPEAKKGRVVVREKSAAALLLASGFKDFVCQPGYACGAPLRLRLPSLPAEGKQVKSVAELLTAQQKQVASLKAQQVVKKIQQLQMQQQQQETQQTTQKTQPMQQVTTQKQTIVPALAVQTQQPKAQTQMQQQQAKAEPMSEEEEAEHVHRQTVFTTIYKKNDARHGHVGQGSTEEFTSNIRRFLGVVFKALKIKSLLDSPCGDCHWQPLIPAFDKISYTGVDIVKEAIEADKAAYKSKPNMKFLELDVVSDPLPSGPFDAVLSRDLAEHLPLNSSVTAYKAMEQTGAKFLLTSFHSSCEKNTEIKAGSCRFIDVMLPPFNFSKPLMYATEGIDICVSPRERTHYKMIGLWKLPALGMGDGRSFQPVNPKAHEEKKFIIFDKAMGAYLKGAGFNDFVCHSKDHC